MGIFSEVGKLITETAEQTLADSPFLEPEAEQMEPVDTEEAAPLPVSLPEIDGEIIMDGEDMLRVVHVNYTAPPVLSEDTIVPKDTAVPEEDLSFWENPPEVTAPVAVPEPPAVPKTNSRKRTAANTREEPAAEPKPLSPPAEKAQQNTAAAITGDVVFPADAAVCADIAGNVIVKGVFTMEGSVTGNVEAREIILRGIIRGSVKCGKLTLLPLCQGGAMSSIQGSITAESLFTEFT